MSKLTPNYSLYLVTDSGANHSSRTLIQSIEAGILGGVSIVQIREKNLDTESFIQLARKVSQITRKYNVPLIINDNIEVALAVNADGVHVGQDDLPCAEARRLLGPNKLLGVSVETPEQAITAIQNGADYLGIQTCFMTQTRAPNRILGPHGVQGILEAIPIESALKTVAIGGIKIENTRRLVQRSAASNRRALNGIAVVSEIVGAADATAAAASLLAEFQAGLRLTLKTQIRNPDSPSCLDEIQSKIPALLEALSHKAPLIYNFSNDVVMNDVANVTLAVGASPVMAPAIEDVHDLCKVASAVALNIGTLTPPFLESMIRAGRAANDKFIPVVLDPVGVGATLFRRQETERLLNAIQVNIIKGNAGEISTIAKIIACEAETVEMRGVDSTGKGFENPAAVVRDIAARERCVVAMTGKVDYVSDGYRTVGIRNGHMYQSRITGSGCMATAVVAAFAAVSPGDPFLATVLGLICINVAAEHAARREDVRGPGTFRAAFLDELANLNQEDVLAEMKISVSM